MSLFHSELPIWEMAFRWANRDPSQLWLRLPLDVRDHFRNLMQAVLVGELECQTLSLEKYNSASQSIPELHIRHYMGSVAACISGLRFDRKLLRWAVIERDALGIWCQRRGIRPPEFWFPDGATDFAWNELEREQELIAERRRLALLRSEKLNKYLIMPHGPEKDAAWAKVKALDEELDLRGSGAYGATESNEETVGRKLEHKQRVKIAVQQIASVL